MDSAHDAFVSHNGRDKPIVERLCRALLEAGVRPWFDKWDLAPGDLWIKEIERVLADVPAVLVCVGAHGWSSWHEAERQAAVARAVGEGAGVVVPVLLPGAPQDPELPVFLRDRQQADLRDEAEWKGEVKRLAATLTGRSSRGPWIDERRERPYRGLQPFTEADAGWMFGREREEAKLLDALRSGERFIAVVGASGSGKSSLVRAGVVPAVRTGAIDGWQRWHALVMRPGARPCHVLALRLLELQRTIDGVDTDVARDRKRLKELGADLASDESTLSDTSDLLLDRDERDERLLLVVDQFEELLTTDADGTGDQSDRAGARLTEEGAGLLRNLLHATSAASDRVRVIITVRADFTGECLSVPGLARRMEQMHFALPPMEAEQLQEAIRRPALRVGYDVEKALTDTLVIATGDQPGRLPLLQHTLDLLWDVRDRQQHRLTYAAYDEHVGSLDESAAKRAEEVFATLVAESEEHEVVARRLFLRLVHLGEGTGDTRRRVPRSELQGDALSLVLDRFIEARLLVTDAVRDTAVGKPQHAVEIAHEALLTRWGRLRRWLDENREALRLRQEVSGAAIQWVKRGRLVDELWRGVRLAQTYQALLHGGVDLAYVEREFLDASREEERRRKDVTRRGRRLRLMGLVASTVVLVVALVVALVKYEDARELAQEKDALAEAKDVEARRADQEAESARRERDAARMAAVAERGARAMHLARVPGKELEALELGVRVVGALDQSDWSSSEMVRGVHEALARARRVVTLRLGALPIHALAWSPDGRRLVVSSGDGTVRLLDGATGDVLRTLEGHTAAVELVRWTTDGRRLATAGYDWKARVWDGDTGDLLATLVGHEHSITDLAWTIDGTRLATSSSDNTARIWDGDTGERVAVLEHPRSVLGKPVTGCLPDRSPQPDRSGVAPRSWARGTSANRETSGRAGWRSGAPAGWIAGRSRGSTT